MQVNTFVGKTTLGKFYNWVISDPTSQVQTTLALKEKDCPIVVYDKKKALERMMITLLEKQKEVNSIISIIKELQEYEEA